MSVCDENERLGNGLLSNQSPRAHPEVAKPESIAC